MDKYKETFETWNKLAELYEEKFMHLKLYNESYDLFCKLINKSNASVLDIGCGPGIISRYLLEKNPDYKIEGIDIAPNMIALAKKNIPTGDFRVADIRDLDKFNLKYDGIVGGFCIPFLSEAETKKFMADCWRLLNDQGIFYISYMDGKPEDSGFKTTGTGDRTYFNYYETEFLISELNKTGFTKPQFLSVKYNETDTHSILIAKKNVLRD